MEWITGRLSQIKQPEYTGPNRCLPCTVVNLLITSGVGILIGLVGWYTGTSGVGWVLSSVFVGLALIAIYLRGYLVPGTPTLTQRYFPRRLLVWFGKAPEKDPETDEKVDVEALLTDLGALQECDDNPDLCVTQDFGAEWRESIETLQSETMTQNQNLSRLGFDNSGEISISEYGQAFRVSVDGTRVGIWPSEAAFLADLGAAEVLASWDPSWQSRSSIERGQLVRGMRVFIDRCPTCGGRPTFGTERVESCCSGQDVTAMECSDCGARIFETRVQAGTENTRQTTRQDTDRQPYANTTSRRRGCCGA
jgi:hypothetical protein